jgi:CBS domain-containing membrane protein
VNNPRRREPLPDEQAPAIGPIGGHLATVLFGLLMRARFANLARHHHSVLLLGAFSFVNGCLSIGIMSTVALVSGRPLIFPSLGPTAFLFFYTPLAPAASPRNTIYGHLIGALAGLGCLALFGLQHSGSSIATGVTGARIGAAALSLGLTSGLMVALKSPHPPAGATTLIFSLGVLHRAEDVLILMSAVILLTLQAIVFNQLAGVPYPLWAAPHSAGAAGQPEGAIP